MKDTDFKIILSENKVIFDENGKIIHHPLKKLYYRIEGKEATNRGYLTFVGNNLDKSKILNDIRVFNLEFFGESSDEMDREAWADPWRMEILKRLTDDQRSWYIGFFGHTTIRLDHIDEREVPSHLLNYFSHFDPSHTTTIQSLQPLGYGNKYENKHFFEIPNWEIECVGRYFWEASYQAYPIEGYNFKSGKIENLIKWDKQPKNDLLFREVVDEVFIMFYTYPEEHRHFNFITNKLSLEEFAELINYPKLQKTINELNDGGKIT
jgi:hypothetical protein